MQSVFPYLGRERWLEAKINDSNLHKFDEKIISVSDHGKGGTLKLNQEVRGGGSDLVVMNEAGKGSTPSTLIDHTGFSLSHTPELSPI